MQHFRSVFVIIMEPTWLIRGANNYNPISLYYIPFPYNLGIIFPKFEVPIINDGSHRGKWILANPFIMAKFQSKKSSVLTPDLSRSWKSTIRKCFSFFKISSGSASKMRLKMKKVGKFQYHGTYPFFTSSNAFLRHFPKEFLKKKDTSISYFFTIYSNLVSKLMISYFEILQF